MSKIVIAFTSLACIACAVYLVTVVCYGNSLRQDVPQLVVDIATYSYVSFVLLFLWTPGLAFIQDQRRKAKFGISQEKRKSFF